MKKFEDSLNTAVFTTKSVVEDKKEITYVVHNLEDGAWQFHSSDLVKIKDAMIVSLSEIIEIDNTLLEIADLPLGYAATRESIKNKWTIQKK